MAVFGEDPAPYLIAQNIALNCFLNPQHPAVLDDAHRAFVGWEIYFFSSTELRERFERNLLRDCGIITDPVSRLRFRPNTVSPRLEHNGRPYYFLSDSTRTLFAAMPDSFALPRQAMRRHASAGGASDSSAAGDTSAASDAGAATGDRGTTSE